MCQPLAPQHTHTHIDGENVSQCYDDYGDDRDDDHDYDDDNDDNDDDDEQWFSTPLCQTSYVVKEI